MPHQLPCEIYKLNQKLEDELSNLMVFSSSSFPEAVMTTIRQAFPKKIAGSRRLVVVEDNAISKQEWLENSQDSDLSVLVSTESRPPDLSLFDFAIGLWGGLSSTRILRLHPLHMFRNWTAVDMARFEAREADLPEVRSHFCDFIYSNKRGDPKRLELLDLVNSYKEVCSYGRVRNNRGPGAFRENWDSEWRGSKMLLQMAHRFSISCENSESQGYTTEKIISSLRAGNVPIYWGNPTVHEDFNPNRFINIHDFSRWECALDEVKQLEENPAYYQQKVSEPWITDGQKEEIDAQISSLERFFGEVIPEALEHMPSTRVNWSNRSSRALAELFISRRRLSSVLGKYALLLKKISKVVRRKPG